MNLKFNINVRSRPRDILRILSQADCSTQSVAAELHEETGVLGLQPNLRTVGAVWAAVDGYLMQVPTWCT